MQQARFGARLHYELHVDETLETALVPPLLLQPLLENALLHGLAQRREGGRVRAAGGAHAGSLHVRYWMTDPGPELRRIKAAEPAWKI